MHEQEKQRAYGERVRRIEYATLTPIVFTCTGRCRPRGYPVPEAARKPARGQTSDGLQPSYGLARMSSLVRSSSLFDSVSSWRQGSSEAEFPPSASRGPGRRRHVLTFLTQI